jgi:uncharacterized protein YbaP (TraB family)
MKRSSHIALLRWFAWILLLPWLGLSLAHAEDRGLLWKIEASGAPPSYLFGTIHTDDARVTDFSPKFKQAFKESQDFMMEVLPPRDMTPIFMKQGSLKDVLRPEELEQVRQLAEMHAIQSDIALRMKPWLLAAIFSLPRAQSPFTLDILLFGLASGSGKRVMGLEDAEAHFGALDSLSDAEQLILLRAALEQTPEEKARDFEAVVQAYLGKEIETIAAVDEKRLGGISPELWEKVRALLLDRRNVHMAEGIIRQMKQSRVFVAVGAAHLPGEGGLLDRLRKAGYRLTPIE